jgi:hypothetical protein
MKNKKLGEKTLLEIGYNCFKSLDEKTYIYENRSGQEYVIPVEIIEYLAAYHQHNGNVETIRSLQKYHATLNWATWKISESVDGLVDENLFKQLKNLKELTRGDKSL